MSKTRKRIPLLQVYIYHYQLLPYNINDQQAYNLQIISDKYSQFQTSLSEF